MLNASTQQSHHHHHWTRHVYLNQAATVHSKKKEKEREKYFTENIHTKHDKSRTLQNKHTKIQVTITINITILQQPKKHIWFCLKYL